MKPRHDREHDAFRRQLPDEPPASAADGEANDELPPPALRPGEHQVREVGARDEEDERGDARQNHHRPGVAGALGCVAGCRPQQRQGVAAVARDFTAVLSKLGRLVRDEPVANEGRGGRGLLDAHAGSKAADDPQPRGSGPPTILEEALGARHQRWLHRQRDPDVGRMPDRVSREALSRDTHDAVADAVQIDRLRQDVGRAAEPSLPERIADHRNGGRPGAAASASASDRPSATSAPMT